VVQALTFACIAFRLPNCVRDECEGLNWWMLYINRQHKHLWKLSTSSELSCISYVLCNFWLVLTCSRQDILYMPQISINWPQTLCVVCTIVTKQKLMISIQIWVMFLNDQAPIFPQCLSCRFSTQYIYQRKLNSKCIFLYTYNNLFTLFKVTWWKVPL
jgi:hypothetical protein